MIFFSGTNENDEQNTFVFTAPKVGGWAISAHLMTSTVSKGLVYVRVTIPGTSYDRTHIVYNGRYVDVQLPDSVMFEGTGKQGGKTVLVRALGQISVHVMMDDPASGGGSDGFLVLPVSQLGTDHYVLAYTPAGYADHSFICVSAVSSEATTVEIRTNSGRTHSFVLLQHESYRWNGISYEDLSGSRVSSDHPITVISGTECSSIDDAGLDPVIESIPPVNSLGTQVIMSPFAGMDNGYKYRILGTHVTTEATISNVGKVILTEGQWYEGDVTDNTIVTIDSNYPILAMEYNKKNVRRYHYDDYDSVIEADSSMILAPSTNMYTSNHTIAFPVFAVGSRKYKYSINVIIECLKVSGLFYDEITSMENWETLTSDNGEMCSVRGDVTAGAVHTVSHTDSEAKFTVSVYGLGFGYSRLILILPLCSILTVRRHHYNDNS